MFANFFSPLEEDDVMGIKVKSNLLLHKLRSINPVGVFSGPSVVDCSMVSVVCHSNHNLSYSSLSVIFGSLSKKAAGTSV